MRQPTQATAILVHSPAKLNLFLHITGQRADGYHNLQTIFQLIDLHDDMLFIPSKSDQLEIHGLDDVPTADNLIFRAMSALHPYRQTSQGYSITLHKKIPTGAGLGGGSSNAATTLLVLNRLWQCHLDTEQLLRIGATLGADVPIFIYGQNAWAEGIGDIITPIDLPPKRYAIIKPDCFISTQTLFSQKKLTRDAKPTKFAAYQQDPSNFVNHFEPLALELYPEVKVAFDYLSRYGTAKLTGTGACVFVELTADLSDDEIDQLIAHAPAQVFVVDSLEQSPVLSVIALL